MIIQVEPNDWVTAQKLISSVDKIESYTSLHLMLCRNDLDAKLKQQWETQFKQILKNENTIPNRYWIISRIKRIKKRMSKYLGNY